MATSSRLVKSQCEFSVYSENDGNVYGLGGRRVSSDKLTNVKINRGINIREHKKVIK